MNLQSIARALGGEVISGAVSAPGPGHSAADRSMRVFPNRQAPQGFRATSLAGDDWRACRAYVAERLGLASGGLIAAAPIAKTAHDDAGRAAMALALWTEALHPAGTLTEAYIGHRGSTLPAEAMGAAIRHHPACPFRLEDGSLARLPAMVALMRDAITNAPRAIHRTALRAGGGGKADVPGLGNPKKMLGPARGAVVKLSPDETVETGLGLTEGIEDALVVLGAGWRPIWACGSAGALAGFPVHDGVEVVTVFADSDPTGRKAARACQARWRDAGRECRILAPPAKDWNEAARARGGAS